MEFELHLFASAISGMLIALVILVVLLAKKHFQISGAAILFGLVGGLLAYNYPPIEADFIAINAHQIDKVISFTREEASALIGVASGLLVGLIAVGVWRGYRRCAQ